MATATLHKFGDFPPELRLKVWHVFLEDEARNRRVVVWDGRVMPFAHLASPLLKVNVEPRERALEFYSTKVDIYSLPDTGEFFPLNEDRLRQLVTDTGVRNEIEIETPDVKENEFALALGQKARDLLESAQVTAPTKGALYFNPERDTILHGYNCGVHLFMRKRSDILQGLENPAPLWSTFSSKVPTSAFQTAKHVLRFQGPYPCRTYLEKSLLKRVKNPVDVVQIGSLNASFDMELAHPALVLGEKESEDLMSHLSNSPKPVRGSLETWCGWTEALEGGGVVTGLFHLQIVIDNMKSVISRLTGVLKDQLDARARSGESSTSSEEYKGLEESLRALENYRSTCLKSMEDTNISVCAPWREHWG